MVLPNKFEISLKKNFFDNNKNHNNHVYIGPTLQQDWIFFINKKIFLKAIDSFVLKLISWLANNSVYIARKL